MTRTPAPAVEEPPLATPEPVVKRELARALDRVRAAQPEEVPPPAPPNPPPAVPPAAEAPVRVAAPSAGQELHRTLSLAACLEMALDGNQQRPASLLAVAMAEAQHRQALSGYWPQVMAKGGFLQSDEPLNFLFPGTTLRTPAWDVPVPSQSFVTAPMTVTIPAGSFGPGFPPAAVDLAVPPSRVEVPGSSFKIPPKIITMPDQDITVADDQSWLASVDARWLLADGGLRDGLRRQAAGGVEAARQEARRTTLEIVDSVKRLYYGAVLAAQLQQVGRDTLARMEATLNLTETMYKEGAGTVKKTDYLNNKVMVETLRSAVALLEKNVELAGSALANTMGLPWNATVTPADSELVYRPVAADLDRLVADSYRFSPDWAKLQAGLSAAEGALTEARSGHAPKLALTGSLMRWWNEADGGMATKENQEQWNVGLGVELPLFEGFRTSAKVREVRARIDRLRRQELLLREGLGLQLRNIVLDLSAAQKRYQATHDAMTASVESRELHVRAYQNDLVETKDVIQAQLMEAFMSAQYYRVVYEHLALQSGLDLVVGNEVEHLLDAD